MTTSTTTQLTVYTAAFVTFSTNDCKTTSILNFLREFDVSTTTSHVSCDGHSAESVYRTTSLSYDLSLLKVLLCVQYLVRNLTHVKHLT